MRIEVSELKVMQSAAGYYLGHGYREDGMGIPEGVYPLPYSRDSDYMSKESAERLLASYTHSSQESE